MDIKGRVALPKNQRDRLEKDGIRDLVVTVDPDGCLAIYPAPLWDEIEAKVMALPATSKYVKVLQRLYVGYATDIELDTAGRMLVPTELRSRTNIDRKVVLIGQGKKLELWDERTWEEDSAKWEAIVAEADPAGMPPGIEDIAF